jgi:hypothetical protein
MIVRFVCRTLLPAAAALALAVPAAVPAPGQLIRHTRGFIESLAADGPVVAYDAEGDQPGGPACNRVYAWNLATGRVTRVSAGGTCDADSSSTGAGVAQLAVAGKRVAWITNIGGNSESNDRLFAATLPKPMERRLAAVSRFGNVDCILTGRTLGGLVGGGAVLAYNLWTTVPGDPSSCETKTTSGSLRSIGARGTTLLRAGLDTLVAADADGGRIAVAHSDGTVTLFSSKGAPLQTIGVEPAKDVALSGNRLVVLTKTRRIQVYNTQTGRAELGRLVPAVAGHLAADGGIAAYAVGASLHVLRLATGRDTVVATAPKGIVGVAVSTRAVVYAYNVFRRIGKPPRFRDIGTVVAIPLSRLRG